MQALLLSARRKRPLSRDDLFLRLHVPWNIQDSVLRTIHHVPPFALDRLSAEEWARLEANSATIVTSALRTNGSDIVRKGLTLADVAASAPPDWTLTQVKHLFGYVVAVLQLTTLPPRGSWPVEIQDLARRALSLPRSDRTVLTLSATLGIGVYRARLVKMVLDTFGP